MTKSKSAIQEPLHADLDGEVYSPGDEGYDEAQQAWNLSADQRPAAVWTVRSVQQVQLALRYAREHGLRVAPQTTGHLGQALPDLSGALLPTLGFRDADPNIVRGGNRSSAL